MTETEKKKRGRPPKNKTTDKTRKSVKQVLTDERFKLWFGIFLLFFTIYLSIAFFSFLFTWQQDMSLFDMGFFQILSQEQAPANSMGKLGAYLSKLFIYKWFGIPAFGFLMIFPLWGFKLLKVKVKNFGKIVIRTLIIMVWLSLFLSFIFGKSEFYAGGVYGYELTQWFASVVGKFGVAVLLIITAIAYIFLTFEKSFIWTKEFFENLSETKSLKKAFRETNNHISRFEKFKENTENQTDTQQNENQQQNIGFNNNTPQTNNKPEDDFSDVFGDKTIAQQNQTSKETTIKHNYYLNDEGQKVPINKQEDIGFEVVKQQEEEIIESANEMVDRLNNRTQLEVFTNEDLPGDAEQLEDFDPTKTLSNFQLPPLSLLLDHKLPDSEVTKEELVANKKKIEETLRNYKIEITSIKATVGPTITLYEIVPAPGVRISKIKNLEDDIALSLSALGIRIIAPMPGRGTIGIEVPNSKPSIVSMKSVLSTKKFQESTYELPVAIGKTISNETFLFDLTKMPHLLIAGATGQGKSVGLNAILASILYKKHPAFVKFVLIDPKKVELVIYERIEKHYLAKLPDEEEAIITDTKKVVATLNSLNVEMDTRYDLLKAARVRNIKEYNAKFIQRNLSPEKGHNFMPYIVLVIDEFADLIMTAGKEVELPLARLAQLARAVGIHLIVATQRPSTNIITGVIKANFPARIAFRVASMIDSRTILDTPGANQLIGRGDMLFARGSDLTRIQCAFIDTEELVSIVDYIGDQQGYSAAFDLPEPVTEEDDTPGKVDLSKRDSLFDEAAKLVVISQQGSTSLIQRKMAIGYNRAGRIMDQLEASGIVGPANGSKPRDVYFNDLDSLLEHLRLLKTRFDNQNNSATPGLNVSKQPPQDNTNVDNPFF